MTSCRLTKFRFTVSANEKSALQRFISSSWGEYTNEIEAALYNCKDTVELCPGAMARLCELLWCRQCTPRELRDLSERQRQFIAQLHRQRVRIDFPEILFAATRY
jgi:hypothetical protein